MSSAAASMRGAEASDVALCLVDLHQEKSFMRPRSFPPGLVTYTGDAWETTGGWQEGGLQVRAAREWRVRGGDESGGEEAKRHRALFTFPAARLWEGAASGGRTRRLALDWRDALHATSGCCGGGG